MTYKLNEVYNLNGKEYQITKRKDKYIVRKNMYVCFDIVFTGTLKECREYLNNLKWR